jgi:hypothetical protein
VLDDGLVMVVSDCGFEMVIEMVYIGMAGGGLLAKHGLDFELVLVAAGNGNATGRGCP